MALRLHLASKTLVSNTTIASGHTTLVTFLSRYVVPNGQRDLAPSTRSPMSLGLAPWAAFPMEGFNISLKKKLFPELCALY